MTLIASLPMYDWPEERGAVDAFWAAFRAAHPMTERLPERLTEPTDADELFRQWRDPALVLGQTCHGPLSLGLLRQPRLLAQSDYSDVLGGRGKFYRSAIIAREGTPCAVPDTPAAALPFDQMHGRHLACNTRDSLSGYLSLVRDGVSEGNFAKVTLTGGHRASVLMVASGQADLAAIDCRSWALACRHEAATAGLTVIGWTAERPGLPYICSAETDPALADATAETLLRMGCHAV